MQRVAAEEMDACAGPASPLAQPEKIKLLILNIYIYIASSRLVVWPGRVPTHPRLATPGQNEWGGELEFAYYL